MCPSPNAENCGWLMETSEIVQHPKKRPTDQQCKSNIVRICFIFLSTIFSFLIWILWMFPVKHFCIRSKNTHAGHRLSALQPWCWCVDILRGKSVIRLSVVWSVQCTSDFRGDDLARTPAHRQKHKLLRLKLHTRCVWMVGNLVSVHWGLMGIPPWARQR